MIGILILLLVGILLSAFFSGNETGFYRVPQLRLMIDSIQGKKIAKGLLWMTNNPSMFVATTLIGNNIANYITSLAIVLGARIIIGSDSVLAEIAAPIAISPFVFIYGELLPKYLYFQAPNRLLQQGGYLFFVFFVLVFPITLVLGALGKLMEFVIGRSSKDAWYSFARVELRKVFQEGEDAGVLQPAQRELAYNLVSNASDPVSKFAHPITKYPSIEQGSSIADALRLAKRNRLVMLTVRTPTERLPIGYVSVIDLHLCQEEKVTTYRPFVDVKSGESIGEALLSMRGARESLARVVDEDDQFIGLISTQQLIEPLLTGNLTPLRR